MTANGGSGGSDPKTLRPCGSRTTWTKLQRPKAALGSLVRPGREAGSALSWVWTEPDTSPARALHSATGRVETVGLVVK